MTNEKGRALPRVHALYGPLDENKVRKFRCCVQSGLSDDGFKTFVGEVKTYLESTLTRLHKEGKVDSAAHNTTVRFVLGKAKHRLGIDATDINLGQLRSGKTGELRKRFDAAIEAARERVPELRTAA